MPDQLKNRASDENCKQRCVFRASRSSDEPVVRKVLHEANLSFHDSNDISTVPSIESRGPALPLLGSTFTCICELDSEIVAGSQSRPHRRNEGHTGGAVPAGQHGRWAAPVV